jgi:hypothetical protein
MALMLGHEWQHIYIYAIITYSPLPACHEPLIHACQLQAPHGLLQQQQQQQEKQ